MNVKLLIDMGNILQASYRKLYHEFQKQGFNFTDLEEEFIDDVFNKFEKLSDTFSIKSMDQFILCFDSSSWRTDIFEYYKKSRRDKKDDVDRTMMYESFEHIKSILKSLGFICLRVNKCEADDVIAILAQELKADNKVFVVSKDKDFLQLVDNNVRIFDPVKQSITNSYELTKKETMDIINKKDADLFKMMLVLNGDTIDGVPNVLSDDDSICNPLKKQKRLGMLTTKKKIENKELLNKLINDNYDNFKRNVKLIAFEGIPENIKQSILKKYEAMLKSQKIDENLVLQYNKYNFVKK